MNAVSNECGLKKIWYQMNVVSSEKVSCECYLKRTGLKCRGLKWLWSQVKSLMWMWSQM